MKQLIGFIFLSLLISLNAQAQITHDAWLDSVSNEDYIGMELTLNNVELSSTRVEFESETMGFYKNNPLNSTEDVLARLSGVTMVRRGNYAWEPTINGLSGGQVNVSIDGMRMFGACTDKMDPVSSYVEPNNLESISIEKGTSGSEHGSTIGGAVAFNLKKPQFNQGWYGDVNSRYETVSNGMSYSGSVNYGGPKLALRMNGGYRNYQNYTDGNGEEVFHSGYKKLNFSLAAAYQTSKSNLINIDFLIDDAREVGYPGLPMDVAFAKAKMFAISYTSWNPIPLIEELELKAYANTVDHLMDDSKREDIKVRMDMPGNTETIGAYVVGNTEKGNHSIRAKIDWYSTSAYANMTMFVPNELDMFMETWPDVTRHDGGAYLSDQLTLSPKMYLNTNIRVEQAFSKMNSEMGHKQFSVFGYELSDYNASHLLLNIGSTLRYDFTDKTTSKLALNYGERLPSVSEMYGFYLYNSFDGYDYLGVPTIEKERSFQLTGAIDLKPNDRLSLAMDGFYYWFEDYIIGYVDESLDAMTIGAKGVKVYENISGVTFTGFNAQIAYHPIKSIEMLYTVKATYALDRDKNPLPLIPPLKNNLTVVGQTKGYKLQVEGEYALQQTKVNPEAGEQMTPNYFLFNIRMNKVIDFENSNLNMSVGVENLLDESYREHLDWGGILRPGRNFYASLNFGF
jgi:iron complex outermembrane receptor protein